MPRSAQALSLNSRHVLVAGFGGLPIPMALAGLDGVGSLREIPIRGDVYVSGAYVKDYPVEPESTSSCAKMAGLNDWIARPLARKWDDKKLPKQRFFQLFAN